jgi:hypothetical protein
MFTTPAERILKDFVEFGDTGCADHEQSPPYQRTDAAEHYAKLINRNGGHHRICSKSYSKGSGMIPRLDVAVECRASEPGLAGRLGGRHAP